jgi:hypothetical protein
MARSSNLIATQYQRLVFRTHPDPSLRNAIRVQSATHLQAHDYKLGEIRWLSRPAQAFVRAVTPTTQKRRRSKMLLMTGKAAQ